MNGHKVNLKQQESKHQHHSSKAIGLVWEQPMVMLGSWSIDVQQDTNKLLEGLTSRIVEGSTGFRIISGDWNLTRDCIAQANYWESLGWREIQDIAKEKWGWVPQATCKNTTIKDFLFVSPELVPLIYDVVIDRSYFPDHAVLMIKCP